MPKKKTKKPAAAKSRPIPPPYDPGYEYFKDKDVAIKNQSDRPVTKQIRYAVVDLEKVLICPLWGFITTTKNFTDMAKLLGKPDTTDYMPESPYNGLKLVCNGTFNGPSGHLVGFFNNEDLLQNKKSYIWNPNNTHAHITPPSNRPRPELRWYFGIRKRGVNGTGPLVIEVTKATSLIPSPLPPAYSTAQGYLKGEYLMLLHGGLILYDHRIGFTPPWNFHSYRSAFNTQNNDKFNLDTAYNGVPCNNDTKRWGIAWLGGSKILIASAKSMNVYEFAQAVYQVTQAAASHLPAIMFDGGGHHGWHVCENEKPEDKGKQIWEFTVDPAQATGKDTHCHFGVFKPVNVVISRIGYKKIPEKHTVNKSVLSMLAPKDGSQLEIKTKVFRSGFFKKTIKLELIITRFQYCPAGTPYFPDNQLFSIKKRKTVTWPSSAVHTLDMNWNLDANDTRKIVSWSARDNSGVVFLLRSLDANDEEIGRQDVLIQLIKEIQMAFLLDASLKVSATLHQARIKAAKMIGYTALAKANMHPVGNNFVGFPTKLMVLGMGYTTNPLMSDWSDNKTKFNNAFLSLGHGEVSTDFNCAFSELRKTFNPVDGAKRKRTFFFTASKHQGLAFKWSEVNHFKTVGIGVNCIGFGAVDNADDEDILPKTARLTGGKDLYTSNINDLISLFQQAYAEDQDEQIVRQKKVTVAPGVSKTERFNLKTKAAATIWLHWDSGKTPDLALIHPNSHPVITPADVGSYDNVDYFQGDGFAAFVIANPAQMPPPHTSHEWKIKITGRRSKGQTVYLNIAENREEAVPSQLIELGDHQVPPAIDQGKDMRVSIFTTADSAVPDNVWLCVRYQGESGFTKFPLSSSVNNIWRGTVSGEFLNKPGVLHSYFEAENEYGTVYKPEGAPHEIIETQVTVFVPPVIQLEDWQVPGQITEDEDMPVSVRVAADSPQPHTVALYARCDQDPSFEVFTLNQHPEYTWKGVVPKEFLKVGKVFSYFKATGEEASGFAPPEAPQVPLETEVLSASPPRLVWVGDFYRNYALIYNSIRFTGRRENGAVAVKPKDPDMYGDINISPCYPFPPETEIAHRALTIDPCDGGVWIFNARFIGGNKFRFKLIKVKPDGSCFSHQISDHLRAIAVDPERNRLWAAIMNRIVIIEIDPWKEKLRHPNFQTDSLAVDTQTGYAWAAYPYAHKYPYLFKAGGGPQEVTKSVRETMRLTFFAPGEIICHGCFYNEVQRRIFRLNQQGSILAHSNVLPLLRELLVDNENDKDIWACADGAAYCFDADLKQKLKVSVNDAGIKVFRSIALAQPQGGVWVVGKGRDNKGFLGHLSSQGELKRIKNITDPWLVRSAY